MFKTSHIDRAIVLAQHRLHVYAPQNTKGNTGFNCIPEGFIRTADGLSEVAGKTNPIQIGVNLDSCVEMCKLLAERCDNAQKWAIRDIVSRIVRQAEDRAARVSAGDSDFTADFYPLEPDNPWGILVLALVEVFGTSPEHAYEPELALSTQ